MRSSSALLLQATEVTKCSQCSMVDGVQHLAPLIARTVDAAGQTRAGMGKEVHGLMILMMFTSYQVRTFPLASFDGSLLIDF